MTRPEVDKSKTLIAEQRQLPALGSILDRLGAALAANGCPARVDIDAMSGNLQALLLQFSRRAERLVRRANAFIPQRRRCEAHISLCEGPSYGAFAIAVPDPFIVLNVGLVPTLTDFFEA